MLDKGEPFVNPTSDSLLTAENSYSCIQGTSMPNGNESPQIVAHDVPVQVSNIKRGRLSSANDSISAVSYSIPVPKVSCSAPIFVEACCGSAKLSFEVKATEMFVLPVDWIQNKHRTRLPAVKLDLSQPSQISILKDLVEQGRVSVVWAAVPCGTASKAREIRVSRTSHGPKQ